MKAKAIVLSALLLTPAASAQVASTAPVAVTVDKTSLPAPMTDAALDEISGEGPITAGTGIVMMVDGVKRMVEDGREGDYLGMALGAGTYLLGKATFAVGVVTPTP